MLVHVVRVVAWVPSAVAPTVHMMMVLICIATVTIVVVKLLLVKMMGWQLMVRLLLSQLITLVAE